MCPFVFCLLFLFVSGKTIRYSSSANERLQELASVSVSQWRQSHPLEGELDCWDSAYDALQGSCMDMTREEKMLYAWRVLVCYYSDTGRAIPPCDTKSMRTCTRSLPSSDFDIFTQFYNHADSMCFYRESAEWRKRTDRSIRGLEDATEQAAALLSKSLAHETELLSLQDTNLKMHRDSLEQGKNVLSTVSATRSELEDLTTDIQRSFRWVHNETESYFAKLHSVMSWTNAKLESLESFQSYFQTSLVEAAAFLLKMVVVFFATAVPGLSLLRPYLYLYVLIATVWTRRGSSLSPRAHTLFNWLFVCGSGCHLGYSLFFKKDVAKENARLLRSLYQRLDGRLSPNAYLSPVRERVALEPPATCKSKCSLRSVCENYSWQVSGGDRYVVSGGDRYVVSGGDRYVMSTCDGNVSLSPSKERISLSPSNERISQSTCNGHFALSTCNDSFQPNGKNDCLPTSNHQPSLVESPFSDDSFCDEASAHRVLFMSDDSDYFA